MAKVSFNKLVNIKSLEDKIVTINGVDIVVKQYLPAEKKAEFITHILNYTIDDLNDFSEFKIVVWKAIETITNYTNISFTEAQMKDITKLYDSIVLNGILNAIIEAIPYQEYQFMMEMVDKEVARLRTYLHSAIGILGTIQQDYNLSNMNIDGLIDKIKNDESIGLVRDILTKVD